MCALAAQSGDNFFSAVKYDDVSHTCELAQATCARTEEEAATDVMVSSLAGE